MKREDKDVLFGEELVDAWEVDEFSERPEEVQEQRVNGSEREVPPLFEPDAIRLGARNWLDVAPPPVEWLLDDILPLGEVSIIAGAGASSKSQLLLQLCLGVATGLGIGDGGMSGALWTPARPRPVLMLTAEERDVDLHRRISRIADAMHLTQDQRARAKQNLVVASVRGMDNRVIGQERRGGAFHQTRVARSIESLCDRIEGLGLVVFEPVSRFRGGDEIDNSAATALVSWMESLSERCGCGVATSAHVGKFANSQLELAQDQIRGASGLVDGARWVAAMRVMSVTEAKTYSILEKDRRSYVQIAIVKANNIEPVSNTWVKRGIGGYLQHRRLLVAAAERHESEYEKVVRFVADMLRRDSGLALTITEVELKFAGVKGELKVGQKSVRRYLRQAVADGDVLRLVDGVKLGLA